MACRWRLKPAVFHLRINMSDSIAPYQMYAWSTGNTPLPLIPAEELRRRRIGIWPLHMSDG